VVAPRRQQADLPLHIVGSATWLREPGDEGYWILFENTTYPVEFYRYSYTDHSGNLHVGDSWFYIHEGDAGDTEYYVRQSDHINPENTIGLGWWRESDTEFDQGILSIIPMTTATEPMQAAAAPMDPAPTQQIAAATTTPRAADPPPTNGRSGSLTGAPPPMFTGDRDKSEIFLDKFLGYELANLDAKQFQVPAQKVALCLTYCSGPKIDAWAKMRRVWLRDEARVRGANDPTLWDDFEADFKAAFTDTDAKLTAAEKLHELHMTGSDIDTYIAEFDRLVGEVGYRRDDWGTIVKFKEGLQPKLLAQILTHVVPAPTTIRAWKKAARERQTVYKELKGAGLTKGGPTPLQKKFAGILHMPNYRTPAQRQQAYHPPAHRASQVVPMDVDAANFTPLTPEERADLSAKRACFYCRKVGHISRNCRSKPGNKQPTASARVATVEPEKPQNLDSIGVKGMVDWIKKQSVETQEKFVDELQGF